MKELTGKELLHHAVIRPPVKRKNSKFAVRFTFILIVVSVVAGTTVSVVEYFIGVSLTFLIASGVALAGGLYVVVIQMYKAC